MATPQRRPVLPPASMQSLPTRAAEALEQGRFRDAIDLFKQLLKHEARPAWKASLNEAYSGRARALAAKQMFKEAAMLLENTRAADGSVSAPLLYATCLIRDGQQPKAAAHLLHAVCGASLPMQERPESEALLAALLTAAPVPPVSVANEPPELARWRAWGTAARQALTAWIEGASADDINGLLGRISLRSAFRPLRLLLQCLVSGPEAAGRSRALLATIGPESPFFPFRQAVDAALAAPDGPATLSPPQQRFVIETMGTPPAEAEAMDRLAAAAASGPAALFAALQKRAGDKEAGAQLADLRGACMSLLPHIPDRIGQFEKQFGRLTPLERARIQAMAAEEKENWAAAETAWQAAADAIAGSGGGRVADLSRAVIFRHLAELGKHYAEIRGLHGDSDPVSDYLERAGAADPEHVQTMLDRMARFREISRDGEWHRLADEAAQRFPQDREVLLLATQSAMARQAFKKAAGFAKRLLAIDPINAGLRRQMVELQISQARKQMRAKRPDLAGRVLDEAGQWERADSPSALLRIFRGLVALQEGKREAAELLIRQGVDLAGGGVAGWFRALLEAELTKALPGKTGWLRDAVMAARKAPTVKEDVLAVVAALATPDAVASKKIVITLLGGMHGWLIAAADLPWSLAEFQSIEDTLVAAEQFGVLEAMARAGRRREPGNPMWRFHEILARTCNDPARMTIEEQDGLEAAALSAAERKDVHAAARLRRYCHVNETMGPDAGLDFDDDLSDGIDDHELLAMLMDLTGAMPKDIERALRQKVGQLGREGAVADLTSILSGRGGPLGPTAPRPVARQLAEAMIAMAMNGKGGRARGGRV